MIEPTVGRVVWYHENHAGQAHKQEQPWDGHVVYVHGVRSVNLVVFDHEGVMHQRKQVKLLQNGDVPPNPGMPYAEWMPYQKGQAARTEAAEAKAAGAQP